MGGWFVAKCEEETKRKRTRKVEEYVRGHTAAAASWLGVKKFFYLCADDTGIIRLCPVNKECELTNWAIGAVLLVIVQFLAWSWMKYERGQRKSKCPSRKETTAQLTALYPLY